METNSAAALMQMKAELLQLTAMPGWFRVTRFAETVLKNMDRAAIDEEDDTKAHGMRHDAKGARKHWNDLLRRIELAKQVDNPATDDQFLDVSMD